MSSEQGSSVWQTFLLLDRRVWVLAGVRAVGVAALSLVMTFLAIYLVEDRGLSGQEVGWLYFSANLLQSGVQSYAGVLSDRLGRRKLMAFGLGARGLMLMVLGGLVLQHAPIAAVSAAMIASASLRGLFEPVAYAMVADLVPVEQRVAGFALQRLGTNVGWAIGPMSGGLLTSVLPYGDIFFCSAPALLACAWVLWRLKEPEAQHATLAVGPPPPGWLRELVSRRDLALFLLCALLGSLAQTQFYGTMSIYAKGALGLSNQTIGLLYTINGLTVLMLQLPAVAYISRLGNYRALVAGSAVYWVAFLCIGMAGDGREMIGAVLLITFGEIVLAPAEQAVAAQLAGPGRLGRTLGAHGGVRMIGVSLAPLLGGLAFDYLRDAPLLMWAGALGSLCVAMVIGFLVLGRLLSPQRR